jgi:hypothetical protein
MRRLAFVLLPATILVVSVGLGPAGACGGLVGENGTIQLTRTVTLAAHHDGVERYVTSFEFTGEGEEVGSIVPLPGVPTKVQRGGDWTLQRLQREVAPPAPRAEAFNAAGAASFADAEVVLEAQIDALDITILRGGGDAVGRWALDHGFFLTPDAPEVLDHYSHRSKVFMAARFDAARARELGQRSGDGTPIMLTIPLAEPWVPLHILSLGLGRNDVVDADVFLLTDRRPTLHADRDDFALLRSETASTLLLDDLRSDKGMKWVPDDMWLTYLRIDATARDLEGDLVVSGSTPESTWARLVGSTR